MSKKFKGLKYSLLIIQNDSKVKSLLISSSISNFLDLNFCLRLDFELLLMSPLISF